MKRILDKIKGYFQKRHPVSDPLYCDWCCSNRVITVDFWGGKHMDIIKALKCPTHGPRIRNMLAWNDDVWVGVDVCLKVKETGEVK